jgi:hypothetical protein
VEKEQKLKQLRIKWKQNPQMRDIILRQVAAIKLSQEPYKTKREIEDAKFTESVIDNLM